jgi:hypothetical protein
MTTYAPSNIDKLGLIGVAEAELSEPDYSFDIVGVWKDANGGLYLSTDSGCSCPSPWESHGTSDEFTGPLTKPQAIEEATALWTNAGKYDPPAFAEFVEAVTKA